MKNFLLYLSVLLMVFSCKENTQSEPAQKRHDGYYISGNAPGLFNGLRAYLKATDEKGFLRPVDTAIIMNEKFVFEGKVEKQEAWYLEINSLDRTFPFIIDNSTLDITVNKDDIKKSIIKGDKVNDGIADLNANLQILNDSLERTSELYRKKIINKEQVGGLSKQVRKIKEAISDLPHEYIKEHPNSSYGLVLLNDMIRRNKAEKGKIVASYDAINDSLKNSYLGKRVSKKIPRIREEYAIIAATHIGKVAPDFSASNPQGKVISLSDNKGKATLIHFWSSWFKASRRENVRLVKVYEKYHDQGLEMIGISLDGNVNQKNPKSDWKKAIKEDKLIWNQISNLNYFNDTICKTYSVKSLPATFLLDRNGVIVAKNLTGNSLTTQIEALLK